MNTELIDSSTGMSASIRKNLIMQLMNIMRKHIGMSNAVSKETLFDRIFKHSMADNIEDWLRWEMVKKAMHFCRVKTNCFIGMHSNRGIYYFYVVNSTEDLKGYNDILENNIKMMRYMQQRGRRAVSEHWATAQWQIDDKSNKRLLQKV